MVGEPNPSSTSAEFSDDRLPATRILRTAGEAVLFLTLFGGVWAFAGDLPEWEFVLAAGIALLTGIWITRCVIYRRLSLRPDLVSVGLSGLILISAVQLIPLPVGLVSVISPGAAHAHRQYRPAQDEVIADEAGPPSPRPSFLPLSLDTSLTRKFLTEVLAVLLVYTVCRNWLSSRGAFRRFAWAATVTGFLLSVFAFVQFFSSRPSEMYWSVDTGGAVFGPFVCRNHFPYFLTPCIGLGFGLLTVTDRASTQSASTSAGPGLSGLWYDFTAWMGQASQSPRTISLLGMLGFMVLSVPFSLSRGGLLSTLAAAAVTAVIWRTLADPKKSGGDRSGIGAVIGLSLIAAVLATFLGWQQVEKRVATLGKKTVLDDRLPLWLDSLRLVPQYPVLGTGGGTFIRAEPTVRTSGESLLRHDNAHNEFVEALVEGGLPRLVLTVLLAYGALATAIRGYRRLRGRSTGNLLLGATFGILAVTFHSIGDFGIHVPSIALLLAAVAGYAAAAADDPDYAPTRRTKHGLSGATHSETELPRSGERRNRTEAAVVLTGPPALAGLAVVAVLALLMAWEFHTWDKAERLRSAAVIAGKQENPDRFERRVDYQQARCRVVPDNPDAFIDLAQAHFDAAIDSDKELESESAKRHVREGLAATRTARNLCPILPNPHFKFGGYRQMQDRNSSNKWFVSSDPAATYFDRAKELLPLDPEAWYAAGVEAFERDDRNEAEKNWKQSLTLSPRQLKPILLIVQKKTKMTVEEIRTRLLPEDAIILMMAADELFPNVDTQRTERGPFLTQAAEILKRKSNQSVAELEVLARVYEQNRDLPGAIAAWRRAVNAEPENSGLRSRYAAWLESEELYEEALQHLEWLRDRNEGGLAIKERIDLARHSTKLKDAILGR